ncbi:MAG: hypothetical protein WA133_11890 [Syntrophales bacterium]
MIATFHRDDRGGANETNFEVLMIVVRGKTYSTTMDAAAELGVSTKTMRQYILKGIIPQPPEIQYGVRTLRHFPPEYMDVVRKRLDSYRQERRQEQAD